MSKYRVVSDQGRETDPGGRVVTFERRDQKKRSKAARRNDFLIAVAIILVLFGLLIASWVGCLVSIQKLKNEPKIESRVAMMPTVTDRAFPEIEEPDVFDEAIPLSADLQKALYDAAEEFGVPYDLALAVVWKETNFTNVMGDGGRAYGYFQIWPRWHGDRMAELGVTDLNDPDGNFRVGCSILGDLLETYGNMHKALMAYNMGPSGAGDLWAQGYTSSGYSRAVMNYMEGLS